MSQNNFNTTNFSSSLKEVEFSTRMIFMIDRLIQQQEKIISLIEAIVPKKEESDNDDFAPTGPKEKACASAEEQLSEHERLRRLKLYRAAQGGYWKIAKRIYDENDRKDFGVEISRNGDTALHIAAAAKHIDFVKELVNKMSENDIKKTNKHGKTAFFFAAMSGAVAIAKEMIKNTEIAMLPDTYGTLPIQMAAALGHKKMVKYLYRETKDSLKEEDCKELFVSSIEMDLYDVALDLLDNYPDLATARAKNEETALHALARKDLVSGGKHVEKEKKAALRLVKLISKKVITKSYEEISEIIGKPRKLLFDAAGRGNVEFLKILIRGYPDLIWKIDNEENRYTIFHYAVKYRQEDVFNLIYEIGSSQEIVSSLEDKNGNNILHLAAMLAPSDRLNIVPGAAQQMRQELLWFKKVQKFVRSSFVEDRNSEGLTPRELFAREHDNLREKGEQWMHDTAESCMVVAALIATVAFAATFTVPGGNNGDTGFPIFLEKFSLMIFVISDAISLVSSSASILNFLSILTSRYTEEDFLSSLPRKFRFGMITLFISIATMMIMFSTTFFIIFSDRRFWMAIFVTIIASIPVIMFIWKWIYSQYNVLCSRYVSDSLFHRGKSSLSYEEREASEEPQKSETFETKCCTIV